MIELLIKLGAFWLSLSAVIMATSWYFATTVRHYCPEWWRRVVVDDIDDEPEFVRMLVKSERSIR